MADLTKSNGDSASTRAPLTNGNTDGVIDTIPEHQASETEDVADRAANMLQGLRGDGDGDDGASTGTGLRVRRRRESADDERKNRRRRRTAVGSSTSSGGGEQDSTNPSGTTEPSTIVEETAGEEKESRSESRSDSRNDDGRGSTQLDDHPTPTTIVSPPSPYGTENKPLEIPD